MSVITNHTNQGDSDTESVAEEPEGWVKVQQSTFTNWCNDKLKGEGTVLTDIRRDFRDGINLCKLVKALRGPNPATPMQRMPTMKGGAKTTKLQASGTLQVAINAIKADGVKLVNIGAEDIREGNLKLILGIIWTLIRRYQIGSETKLAPKKLMLAWINAVLYPHMTVKNFHADFQDGQALQGIMEFCKPGTFPNWPSLQRSDRVGNCKAAMDCAASELGIPIVVSPENMANMSGQDELSAMTYLSYFMEVGSCGFNATLNWVRERLPGVSVTNFDTDWNDGTIASQLSRACGGQVPDPPPNNNDNRCENAIQASYAVVPSLMKDLLELRGKDMADPKVDHIGVMAFAAWHRHAQGGPPAPAPTPAPVPAPVPVPVFEPVPTPEAPQVSVDYNQLCRIDNQMTLTVDTTSEGKESVHITAHSPSGDIEDLVVSRVDECKHTAALLPTERGDWSLEILYSSDRVPVAGNLFPLHVFDPSKARICGGTGDTIPVNTTGCRDVNCIDAGLDDITGNVIFKADNSIVNHQVVTTGVSQKSIQFVPHRPGIYVVSLFLGGTELEGSPFEINVTAGAGIRAYGQGLEAAIQYNEVEFMINCSESPNGNAEVIIQGQSGQFVNNVVIESAPSGENAKCVKYTPDETGPHQVTVKYNDVEVPGSPFTVQVREPIVRVSNISKQVLTDQMYTFDLDAHECKKGQVCLDTGLSIHHYNKLGNNTYAVEFLSRKTGDFDIVVTYNGKEVEGSPFLVKAVKPN